MITEITTKPISRSDLTSSVLIRDLESRQGEIVAAESFIDRDGVPTYINPLKKLASRAAGARFKEK